ncbi:MAG: hypothetical protein WDO73_05245 [Ignavibacteriota bacterium]
MVGTQHDDDLALLFRKKQPAALQGIVAPSTIRVQLQTDNSDRWFRVTLTPQGKVVGFQETKPKDAETVAASAAHDVAESAMSAWWGPTPALPFRYREPSKSSDTSKDRTFTWRGGRAGSEGCHGHLSRRDVWRSRGRGAHQRVSRRQRHGGARSGERLADLPQGSRLDLSPAAGYLLDCPLCAPSLDREISHQRTVLAALAFVLMSALLVFDPGYLAAQVGSDLGSQRTAVTILMMIGFCLCGAFFGVAYGAGRGRSARDLSRQADIARRVPFGGS